MLSASERASIVFAVPGTSSSRTCPPEINAESTTAIWSVLTDDDTPVCDQTLCHVL